LGSFFFLALAGAVLAIFAAAQAPRGDFHASVRRAAELSTLTQLGAQPFHLKLTTQDTTMRNPEYNVEIEFWWEAPDRWRRAVKSPAFMQTAIRNGGRYYESSSATDYLPYWLDELIRGAVDPIPVDALTNNLRKGRGTVRWRIPGRAQRWHQTMTRTTACTARH
jgi:hypothetical protein